MISLFTAAVWHFAVAFLQQQKIDLHEKSELSGGYTHANNQLLSLPPGKFLASCPEGTVYDYNMTSCNRTCRSLSQVDYSCQTTFPKVDGCGCAQGTYMNEAGKCVPSESCPCYDKDTIIPAGQAISKDGTTW